MKVEGFSKEKVYTPDFNANKSLGEDAQLTIKFAPLLDNDELIKIRADLIESGFAEALDTKTLSNDQMKLIIEKCGSLLPSHISIVKGAEGYEVNDIVKSPFFLGLAVELLFVLIDKSSPNKVDAKN